MGIYYDAKKPTGQRWVVSYEKTDYTPDELETNRPTNLTRTVREPYTQFECIVPGPGFCFYGENITRYRDKTVNDDTKNSINAQLNKDGVQNLKQLQLNQLKNKSYDHVVSVASRTQGGDYKSQRQSIRDFIGAQGTLPENLPTGSALYQPRPTNLGSYQTIQVYASDDPESGDYYAKDSEGNYITEPTENWDERRLVRATRSETIWVPDDAQNAANERYNAEQQEISRQNELANTRNKEINALFKNDPSNIISTELQNQFKTFYRTEKLQAWDPALGAKPQYGDFDSAYYKQNNPQAVQQWQSAVADDDIDITERYGEEGFYLQHYTTQGKPAGARGNAPEATAAASSYVEKTPTESDLQAVRDLQLGIDTGTQTDRLLNVPAISEEWDKARGGDPYWDSLAKKYYLDVNKKDDFAALFRLSDRPEDKQISFNYNANAGYGVTELEDALTEAVGEKAQVDVKRFGALAQNVLKDTIAELTKARQKEQMLDLMGGFSGFNEIMNINQTLADSILGDTGVGGVLSFTSAGKAEESLLKNLQGITGVQNNNTYNWQQWFDNTLKAKYSQAQELGYTAGEAQEMVNIDADFAKQFIETYLQPRFDESRSMNEFVEYLDIRQEEQNPFQTQDIINATQLVADLRSKAYLDSIAKTPERYFNADFYFNPSGDAARADAYVDQARTVSEDWEAAKNGDPYWAQQAYRFGIDLNNKEQFARMHFQIKGQGRGYDAADDILNASKVTDQIYNNILPALKEEALKQGSVFGQFITPDEFADEMLAGLDPNDKGTWDEVLKRYGLTDFKGTVEELKEYIKNTLRTGTAEEIRAQIKYLNERRQRPTQEVLGLSYIERPEDYKDEMATPQTELFKTFQSAGYQGTEDEFYTKFFPDLDRSEQTLLTKAGSNEALKTYGLDMSDPFASLGTIESFFDEPAPTTTTSKTSDTDLDSYFKLGLDEDDEEEGYQKSASGEKILGEFTSMFKGF